MTEKSSPQPAPARFPAATEQQAFEAEYLKRFNAPGFLFRDADGNYQYGSVGSMWKGWQMARTASRFQSPEGAEWAGAVAFIQHAQNASGSAGADGHWPDEFLAWYKPADWMGEHRAAAVFIGAKIAALAAQPQAAPAITEAEIDRIAALTEKAMEEGLRGFCKTWGWQQFARTLVENLRPYGLRITPKEPTNDR